MRDAIVVENLGKRYSRHNPNRPRTIHEALLRGLRGLRSTESFWALRVNVKFPRPPRKHARRDRAVTAPENRLYCDCWAQLIFQMRGR